jgi:hypothetical protein
MDLLPFAPISTPDVANGFPVKLPSPAVSSSVASISGAMHKWNGFILRAIFGSGETGPFVRSGSGWQIEGPQELCGD